MMSVGRFPRNPLKPVLLGKQLEACGECLYSVSLNTTKNTQFAGNCHMHCGSLQQIAIDKHFGEEYSATQNKTPPCGILMYSLYFSKVVKSAVLTSYF